MIPVTPAAAEAATAAEASFPPLWAAAAVEAAPSWDSDHQEYVCRPNNSHRIIVVLLITSTDAIFSGKDFAEILEVAKNSSSKRTKKTSRYAHLYQSPPSRLLDIWQRVASDVMPVSLRH